MSGAVASAKPSRNATVADRLSRNRRNQDRLVQALCLLATAIGLAFLLLILATLLYLGVRGLSLGVFTTVTKPPGSHGGLLNAIIGSLIQTGLGTWRAILSAR